jgi:sensor histidine kinase regulating citrate/malate metabolism
MLRRLRSRDATRALPVLRLTARGAESDALLDGDRRLIVKHQVEELGGRLGIESECGTGTTVTVTLPQLEPGEEGPAQP